MIRSSKHWGRILAVCVVLAWSAMQASATMVWDFNGLETDINGNGAHTVAVPLSLAEVNQAGGIQVGDKVFSHFELNNATSLGAIAPDEHAVEVVGVFVDGNYGLCFQGGWFAGAGQIVDTTIKFKVEVAEDAAARQWVIVDNELWISAFGVSENSQGGLVSISENVYAQEPGAPNVDPSENPPIANKLVYYFSDQDNDLFDDATFSGRTEIWVVKDIVLSGGGGQTGLAHLSEFYQTFSQIQIPEPATFALLSLGVGVIAARRRRRKA